MPQIAGILLALAGVIALALQPAPVAAPAPAPVGPSPSPPVASASPPRAKPVGLALAFAVSILWALGVVGTTSAGRTLSGPLLNACKMTVSLALVPLIARASGTPFSRLVLPFAEVRRYAWIMALECLMYAAYVYCLTHGPVAIGATLSSLAPVASVAIAARLGLERLSWPRALAVGVTTAGAALLLV
jgi:drug/metabolite transporter (DMT)-like permease